MSYLDGNGLATLWSKIKQYVDNKIVGDIPDNSITEAKLVTAVKDKLNNIVTYTNHSVTVNYSAGTPGTRGQVTILGFASDFVNSHILVGYVVYDNGSSATMRAEIVGNGTNIYLVVYRANTSAVSNQTIKVRLAWIPSD